MFRKASVLRFLSNYCRVVLISDGLGWPNGLAIDRPANRLYWNDGKRKTIESCSLNGKERRVILTQLPHPYGLVIVGSHMYWTDWSTKALHRADKVNGSDNRIIKGHLEGLMDIRSIQVWLFNSGRCYLHKLVTYSYGKELGIWWGTRVVPYPGQE